MKKFCCIVLATVAASLCYGQAEKLGLKLRKGETYTQNQTSKIAINQTINGQPNAINMSMSAKTTFKVLDIVNSEYNMEVRFSSLAMSISTPAQMLEFSSEKNNPNDIVSSIFSKMKDKPFEIKLSQQGKVTEVRNLNSLYNNIFDSFPQLSDQQKEQIKAQVTQSFGENSIKGNIEMLSAIFPEKEVVVGDKWTNKGELQTNIKAELQNKYELKESNKEYYIIAGNSDIQSSPSNDYTLINGFPIKYDLKGKVASLFKVDKNTGWTTQAQTSQTMNGKALVKASAELPNGMTIPMTISNESLFTE